MAIPQISATISKEDIDSIMQSLTSISGKLPFLISLKDEDRKKLHHLKDINHGFVMNSLKLADTNPGFLPKDFDMAEFQKDSDLFDGLFSIKQAIASLFQKIDDTTNVAGNEAYLEALSVYDYAIAGNVGTKGIEPYLDEMARRFARKSKKNPPSKGAQPSK